MRQDICPEEARMISQEQGPWSSRPSSHSKCVEHLLFARYRAKPKAQIMFRTFCFLNREVAMQNTENLRRDLTGSNIGEYTVKI